MLIFPAIDLFEGKAVRLYKGDYNQMTVYNDDPLAVAADFKAAGATCLHVVDLEGARSGDTPNLATVAALAAEEGTSLYRVLERAGEYPILERVAGTLSDFVTLIVSLREFSLSHPVSETVAQVFEKTGYKDMLKAGGTYQPK